MHQCPSPTRLLQVLRAQKETSPTQQCGHHYLADGVFAFLRNGVKLLSEINQSGELQAALG